MISANGDLLKLEIVSAIFTCCKKFLLVMAMQTLDSFNILVTDVNYHIRTLLKRELKEEQYIVSCLENGAKVHKLMVSDHMWDLIILDPDLLRPYGHSVLKKSLTSCTTVPILLHSYGNAIDGIKLNNNVCTIEKSDSSIQKIKETVRYFYLLRSGKR